MSKKRRKELWQGGTSKRAEKLLEKIPGFEKKEWETHARLDEAQEAWGAVPYWDTGGERQARGRVARLTHNLEQIQRAKRKAELWLRRNPKKVATVTNDKKVAYPKPRKRKDDERCQWWYPTGGRCWRKVAVEGGRFCEEHEDSHAQWQAKKDGETYEYPRSHGWGRR